MLRARPSIAMLLAVFALGLIVRLAIVYGTAGMPLGRFPALDSRQYLVWAGWILEGRLEWPQPTVQGPLYPLFLAGLLAITGGSLTLVAAAQSVVGALSCVLTSLIASRWFDRSSAIAAGMLQAIYAPLAWVETSLLVEGLFLFLISSCILAVTSWRGSMRGLAAAGVLAGLAAICRSTAVPMAIALGALVLLDAGSWRTNLRRLAVFVLGATLVMLPVAAKNASEGGGWRLQGKGGLNFWIGNTPGGDGLASFRIGEGWDRADGDADRAGVSNAAAHDRYYVAKTLREIAGAPGAWLRVMAAKIVWSVQHEEVRDSLSFHFFAAEMPWLRWLPRFGILLPLAICGLIVALRRHIMPRELVAWLLVSWLTLVLLVVGLRYRLPLVPPLIVFAGVGLTVVVTALRARQWKWAAQLGLAAAIAGTAAQIWRHEPSHVFAEELAYTGHALQAERRFFEAETMYRGALAADPQSALAWMGLGVRYYNVAALDDARAAVEQAVNIDPYYADAWMRLAWIAGRERQYPLAVSHMRRAAEIYPRDREIRRYLGRYLFEAGDFAAAARELERVVIEAPQDEEAASLLKMARERSAR